MMTTIRDGSFLIGSNESETQVLECSEAEAKQAAFDLLSDGHTGVSLAVNEDSRWWDVEIV